ncbi:MAG: HDOD domain-containing protein [Zoogloeaceae bacterium]|jgi:EAL and modified HD-GYP domain-containing signal transduction protein|nr:HDOD domain-containing protein [Zoogloeaceae bacterium]
MSFLRNLFGMKEKEERLPAMAVQPKNEQAPPAAPPAPAAWPSPAPEVSPSGAEGEAALPAFVCREALLGRDQRIVGYEFSHPQSLQSNIMKKRARVRQFYDEVLLRHLAGLQLESFLGERLALLGVAPISLAHPMLADLPKANVALALHLGEDKALPQDEALERMRADMEALRAQGMRIGLKWRVPWTADMTEATSFWQQIKSCLDFILLDWPEFTADAAATEALNRLIAHARQEPSLRLIACELAKPDDFQQCYRLGFDLFQGAFINNREPGKVTKDAANRLRIVQLLNGLRKDEETRWLTQELQQDPVLSYRLLRYVNTPAFGMPRQITGIGQAVTILGRSNLYRWLSSLLFKVSDPGYYEWALAEQALARAALMERLRRPEEKDVTPDALFLTGLFSLLDKLMDEPLEALAEKILIPPAVSSALIRREGLLAHYLELAEACERMDPQDIAQRAAHLGLSDRAVNLATFDALAWAHEMTRLD